MSAAGFDQIAAAKKALNECSIRLAEERRRRVAAENGAAMMRVFLEQACDVLQGPGANPEAIVLGVQIQAFLEDTAPRTERRGSG